MVTKEQYERILKRRLYPRATTVARATGLPFDVCLNIVRLEEQIPYDAVDRALDNALRRPRRNRPWGPYVSNVPSVTRKKR